MVFTGYIDYMHNIICNTSMANDTALNASATSEIATGNQNLNLSFR